MIREVTLADAPRLLEIYAHYVRNTAVSFEVTVPSLEEFRERIERLVNTVSISLTARNGDGLLVGVLFGLTDFCYWLYVTDLGVDRAYERQGIGSRLMKTAHALAGGEKDVAVYLIANENAVPFYEKLGMKYADDVMQYNHIEWTEWTVN